MSKKNELIQSVKGTRDLLPGEISLWQQVEQEARRVFEAYNFREIRTPILEQTALFARSVGADTDIVTKEMYTFEDHELQDLASLRARIVERKLSIENNDAFGLYEDQVKSFAHSAESALDKGLMPRTPENWRAVQDIPHLLSTIGSARSQGDEGRFDLHVGSIRDRLQAIRLGDSLTLRPEATASVVRAYIENTLYNEGGIHKLYYMGPMFRRERPQKGRYRQFYQIGAEVLGSDHPTIDAEVLEMLALLLERLGLKEFRLLVNSVGCTKCRPQYLKKLRQALEGVKEQLCADCRRRAHTNPLRVLDCKVEADQPIIERLPHILDSLCLECRQHFECVTTELEERGVAFEVVPRLVRGLDYYTRTTFEITSGLLGAQNALLGGGRYDGLAEMLGGPAAPGFGFAIGEDRLILTVEQSGGLQLKPPLDVYVAWMGEAARGPAMRLMRELRREGMSAETSFQQIKLKKSLGQANKQRARHTVIIGEDEVASGQYQLKDMETGEQAAVDRNRVAAAIRAKLGEAAAPGAESSSDTE